MKISEKYYSWLNHPEMPDYLKNELKLMSKEDIENAFFKDVEFGTAGMRGLLGAGTNRLNIFTVRRATIGFANYLSTICKNAKKRGVAIAHDNRYMSREFTMDIANTLNKMGFDAYVFNSLRPTPQLSYAVRELNCIGGIVITASHNPKEYNGYKVYDEDGCQLIPEKIDGLLEQINKLPDFLNLKTPVCKKNGITHEIPLSFDDKYIEAVKSIQINNELRKDDFKVVFSPQHGTGSMLGMRLLNELGYAVYPVSSQLDPLPGFDNTKSPNPEDPAAYEQALIIAEDVEADLIVVTDPDADRVGVGYRNRFGKYDLFTGNDSGALLLDYLLSERQKRGLLRKNSTLYTTIVTSKLGVDVAKSYGINVKLFLTGFKFIGHEYSLDEVSGDAHFEFGYEESYGCLIKPFVRDKDALQALVMYLEMANYYKKKDMTLDQAYDVLCSKHGYYSDITKSITFEGAKGALEMEEMLSKIRATPPKKIADQKVITIEDYLTRLRQSNNGIEKIKLPQSDVIKFHLENENTITIRPSGTEPKCKFYYGVKSLVSKEKAVKTANEYHLSMLRIIDK